ncbi:hypothetical protein Pst134EA_017723 [Puccinia striiformis f. sp. tritici]|uniref:hypothetical protein n=1 Tax=Puccinia striiformis f. sp. tritici TaxID=168172 RepID=UPI002008005D|nr:hypothetical protein Pst134EA_017723 [Puccinia striiformis f. sp. tritici]KAH9461414.1 hypothetical protein Pst134EA_017723 [Puccinia striiformis f. sp. tritici]KAI9628045.1 hypothetical protein H4Q26_018230 [Puccinia striiformis f. sp. tritici PST-130]
MSNFHTEARSNQTATRQNAFEPNGEDPGTPDSKTNYTDSSCSIADPKVEVIRKLASRITDALAADISNVGTNEDEAGA